MEEAIKIEMHEGQRVRLKELVNELAVSENAFVKRVGLSPNYFFQFRKKGSLLTPSTLRKIKSAIGNLNEEWLRTGEGERSTDGNPIAFGSVEVKPKRRYQKRASSQQEQDGEVGAENVAAEPAQGAALSAEAVASARELGEAGLTTLVAKYQQIAFDLQRQNVDLQARIVELTEKALRQQDIINRLLQEKISNVEKSESVEQ